MAFEKFKTKSYFIGERHQSATISNEDVLTETVQKFLIG